MDTFWINNPYIIFKDYFEIIPTYTMSRIKQMNTVTRFLIYFLILCILFDSGDNFIIFALIAIMLIVAFYYIYKSDFIGVKVYFSKTTFYSKNLLKKVAIFVTVLFI